METLEHVKHPFDTGPGLDDIPERGAQLRKFEASLGTVPFTSLVNIINAAWRCNFFVPQPCLANRVNFIKEESSSQ